MITRRTFLRTVGVATATATAGCFDQLGRSATDSRRQTVGTSTPDHTAASFTAYVERMRERYGEYGVWGLGRGPMDDVTFAGAWSDQWSLRAPKTPTENGKQILVPIDSSAALYRVTGRGQPVYRLWLWSAAHPKQSDEGFGRTAVIELSVGMDLDQPGSVTRYAPLTSIGPKDTPARVALSDSAAPSSRRAIPTGRIQATPDQTAIGPGGAFTIGWAGRYGNAISVAGVCELKHPSTDYEFELTNRVTGVQGTL